MIIFCIDADLAISLINQIVIVTHNLNIMSHCFVSGKGQAWMIFLVATETAGNLAVQHYLSHLSQGIGE